MRPGFSSNNVANGHLTTAKGGSDLGLGMLAAGIKLSNFKNHFRVQLGSSRAFSSGHPSLFGGIQRIIFCRSGKQMIRVYASRKITFVENIMSVWDSSKMQNPRSPVCSNSFGLVPAASNVPIPTTHGCPSPYPARPEFWIRLRNWTRKLNLLPKTFKKIGRQSLLLKKIRSKVWPRNQVHFGYVTLSAVRSARGQFIFAHQGMKSRPV